MLRGTKHLQETTPTHVFTWFGTVLLSGLAAFLIAEGIPFFAPLLGLIGAIFATTLCLCLPALMWFNENQRKAQKEGVPAKITFLYALNAFILILGIVLCFAGTWASILTIRDLLRSGLQSQPFSCADNSV